MYCYLFQDHATLGQISTLHKPCITLAVTTALIVGKT